MEAGVHGVAMVFVIALLVDVIKGDIDRVPIHIHSMEGWIALDHHLNQLPAILTVVQVKT